MLRCELHCHSEYSRDSSLSLERIIATCEKRGVHVVALTDHNEIAGAQKLKDMAPDWLHVIVGEEVATAQGDVIGLFLTERIAPRLDIKETIRQIHAQGGLVLIPHPFDRIRREAIGREVLDSVKDDIDFIEVFNSRCLLTGDNHQAAQFADKHRIPTFVGSDAHTAGEYGNATCSIIEPPKTAEHFKKLLEQATLQYKYASKTVHIQTAFTKIAKRRLQ